MEPESNRDDAPRGLDPDRLLEATSAVVAALEEWAAEHHGAVVYPVEMMGAPEQPRVLCDFTLYEVKEASEFLVRMGMLAPPHARSAE